MTKFPTRILSCIQPTGSSGVHIGNYLGAIRQWTRLQSPDSASSVLQAQQSPKDASSGNLSGSASGPAHVPPPSGKFLCGVVDLHTSTVPWSPTTLRNATYETALMLLSCGIDPKHSILFRQSAVPQHAELCWLLGCVTSMNWLYPMVQFKDKSSQTHTNGLGLFAYPVLQAADILLYRATHVPVGEDQRQHLELAGKIATTVNRVLDEEVFPVPVGVFGTTGNRVMNLRDGTKKMSKSAESDMTRINMTDDMETVRRKIRKAKSDTLEYISYDVQQRPEVSNLVELLSCVSDRSIEDVCADSTLCGQGTKYFKEQVADAVVAHLTPIHKRYLELKEDRQYVKSVLEQGTEEARELASSTWDRVKTLAGYQ